MVGLLAQRIERRSRLFEVAHASDDVDDRLGGDSGDRGGTDVVDATFQPRSEHPLQERALTFKAPWPCGIVRDDGYPLVGHRLSVTGSPFGRQGRFTR